MDHSKLLYIEEIAQVVRVAAEAGVKHVRLTGGEPLVRKRLLSLVEQIRQIDSIETIALTTNGTLLPAMAHDLKAAGVDRVNISLDTLDKTQFEWLTRRGKLQDTLAGIDAAFDAGFDPVKVNCVVIRALQQNFLGFAKMTLERPVHIRFIEFMPVGYQAGIAGAGWSAADIIPSAELCENISQLCNKAGLGTLQPATTNAPKGAGPATYYTLPNAKGTIGFISSVSNHFCSRCNRMRLTADGCLRPCLFSDTEIDIKPALRQGCTDDLRAAWKQALAIKPDEHHNKIGTERNMSKIGG